MVLVVQTPHSELLLKNDYRVEYRLQRLSCATCFRAKTQYKNACYERQDLELPRPALLDGFIDLSLPISGLPYKWRFVRAT